MIIKRSTQLNYQAYAPFDTHLREYISVLSYNNQFTNTPSLTLKYLSFFDNFWNENGSVTVLITKQRRIQYYTFQSGVGRFIRWIPFPFAKYFVLQILIRVSTFPVTTLLFVRRLGPGTLGVYVWIIVHHTKSPYVPQMEPHTTTSVCSSEKCAIWKLTSLCITLVPVQVM